MTLDPSPKGRYRQTIAALTYWVSAAERGKRHILVPAALVLTAVILVLRFLLVDEHIPLLVLLAIPLGMLGVEFGLAGALALAVAGFAILVGVDALLTLDYALGDYIVRCVLFLAVAGGGGLMADMTREMRLQADIDELTDLFNRRAFDRAVRRHEADSARYGPHGAILFLDLDGFKEINDSAGHRAGDIVLQAVAKAIESRVRRSDVVGRIGGDEFGVLLARGDATAGRVVAQDIVAAIREVHCPVEGRRVGASVGVAAFADYPEGVSALLSADAAMYQAKRTGGDSLLVQARPKPN